ncbi:MAG: type II toxin-antitoxin system RelE/ParE family toxin [Terriglobia bacterium]
MAYDRERVIRVIPMAVVEMPEFRNQAAKVLPEEEILEMITEIAQAPQAGAVIAGTGCLRKLRCAASGRGKRGGARVIYVYYGEDVPVFLLSCYPKNAKEDLTAKEKKEFKKLVEVLRTAYEAGLHARIEKARVRRA